MQALATPVPRKSRPVYKSAVEEFDRKNRAATDRLLELEREAREVSQKKVDQFMKWQQSRKRRGMNERMSPPIMGKKKLARLRRLNIKRAKISSQHERQVCELMVRWGVNCFAPNTEADLKKMYVNPNPIIQAVKNRAENNKKSIGRSKDSILTMTGLNTFKAFGMPVCDMHDTFHKQPRTSSQHRKAKK